MGGGGSKADNTQKGRGEGGITPNGATGFMGKRGDCVEPSGRGGVGGGGNAEGRTGRARESDKRDRKQAARSLRGDGGIQCTSNVGSKVSSTETPRNFQRGGKYLEKQRKKIP